MTAYMFSAGLDDKGPDVQSIRIFLSSAHAHAYLDRIAAQDNPYDWLSIHQVQILP